ncbi:MAG: oligosaccharide flippase family protein [bacterium]|jgi:O-antigen/teichoic acid export membrane protein|nr:oligosaccharide flippase family protein [candidate division KSB1 bacterium]MDH7559524.1 oligosaccharide flippase family protein [bacterium]
MRLRGLARETVIYAIGNAGLRAGAFLLIPLYTHTLPMQEYGLLATLLLTMQVLGIVMGLGVRTAFMRFCAEFAEKGQLGRLLGSAYALVAAGGIAVTAVAMTLLKPLFAAVLHTVQPGPFVLLVCMAALAQTLWMLTVSYFRARNMGGAFVALNGVVFLLLASSTVLFLLQLHVGLKGVLWAYVVSYGLMWVMVSMAIARVTGLTTDRATMRRLVRFGFPLIFAMSGDLALDSSALYAMSVFSGLEEVAVYSLGFKIAQIAVITLILPFQLAYEPAVYGVLDSPALRWFIGEALIHLFLAFGFVAMGIVFVFRDLIHAVAPAEYGAAFGVAFALLPGVACIGAQYVGESLLLLRGKTRVSAAVVSGVSLVSIGLNVWLIRLWGMHAAVLVYNVAHIAIGLLLVVVGMRYVPIQLHGRRLAGTVALFLGGTTLVWAASRLPGGLFYPLAALAILAALYCARELGIVDLRLWQKKELAEHAA